MNLILAIGLIWLAFAAGYCLSGMLGAGTREELERENARLRGETIKLKVENKALRKDMELIQKEARFKNQLKSEGR